jgi:hypothetical protein
VRVKPVKYYAETGTIAISLADFVGSIDPDQPDVRYHTVIPSETKPPVSGKEQTFSAAAEDYRGLDIKRTGRLKRIFHSGIIYPVTSPGFGKMRLIFRIAVI